jgi:hypothetical protein
MSRTKGDTHPRKLTRVVCDKICEGVLKGNYITTVCKSVGIHPQTYYSWKKKGEQGIEPYKQFYDRVTECEAQAEMDILNVIYTNAIDQGNWLSSAWILERKYPNRFGKREQMALATDNDFKLEISTAKSPYEMGLEEKKLLEEDRKDE